MSHRFADPFEVAPTDVTEQLPQFEHRESSSAGIGYWMLFAIVSFAALGALTPLAS